MRAIGKAPQRLQARSALAQFESRGRRVGAVTGSYITDLAAIRQTIILCSACDAKWKHDYKRHQYEPHKQFHEYYGGVIGSCDACREMGMRRKIYIHQSFHGQV